MMTTEPEKTTEQPVKPIMWRVCFWTISNFILGIWLSGFFLSRIILLFLGKDELSQGAKAAIGLFNIIVGIGVAAVAFKRSKARGGKAPWKSFTLQINSKKK